MLQLQPLRSKPTLTHALLALCLLSIIYTFHHIHSARFTAQSHPHDAPPEPLSIPKTLWYKLGPQGLNPSTRRWTSTCVSQNPSYSASYVTDATANSYVLRAFASRPDIVGTYLNLSIPIIKADLLRYMLLFDRGGVWSDLDVSCEENTSIDDWVPDVYKKDAGLVVGWEFDAGWWEGQRQFASWVIMSRAGNAHLLAVVQDIVRLIQNTVKENNVSSVADVTLPMVGDVVNFSGPRRLTDSVFASLGRQMGRNVSSEEAAEIKEPKLIGDVLVLPGRAFAASVNKYRVEGKFDLPPVFVTHHYAGTWKNEHGGEE